jgi:hypothetical protein
MSVRVFVPTTWAGLASLVESGRIVGPVRAHAVTQELCEAWPEADEDEWEYASLCAAAVASRELSEDQAARRVVVAADVSGVESVAEGEAATEVELAHDLVWRNVAAVHLDEASGADDDDDLAWFATQEIAALL